MEVDAFPVGRKKRPVVSIGAMMMMMMMMIDLKLMVVSG